MAWGGVLIKVHEKCEAEGRVPISRPGGVQSVYKRSLLSRQTRHQKDNHFMEDYRSNDTLFLSRRIEGGVLTITYSSEPSMLLLEW